MAETPESVTNRPSQARLHAMGPSFTVSRQGWEIHPVAVWVGLAVLFALFLWALACAPLPFLSVDYSRAPGRGAANRGLVPANLAATPVRRPSETPLLISTDAPAGLSSPLAGDLSEETAR